VTFLTAYLSFFQNVAGRVDLGYRTSEEALRMAEESGDLASQGITRCYHGIACYFRGLLPEATWHLTASLPLIARVGQREWEWSANSYLGLTYLELAEHGKMKTHLARALAVLEAGRELPSLQNLYKVLLGIASWREAGATPDTEVLCGYARENKLRYWEGAFARTMGALFLDLGGERLGEAEEWIQRAIRADGGIGIRWGLAMDHAVYGEFFERTGEAARAREHLGNAVELFQECGADGWVSRTEEKLAGL
jgi:tetratricopeptide (TPR) repeat protein